MDSNDTQVDPTDAHIVSVSLPLLKSGTYTVVWRVQSADDGHVSSGSYYFQIARADGSAPPAPTGGANGGVAGGLTNEAGEARAVIGLPDVIAGVGEEAAEHALAAERGTGDGREIAGGAGREVAAPGEGCVGHGGLEGWGSGGSDAQARSLAQRSCSVGPPVRPPRLSRWVWAL